MNGLSPTNIIGNLVDKAKFPEKLNFVISGRLRIMFTDHALFHCEEIRIGQGHNKHGNNWWMGGPSCRGGEEPSDPLTCVCVSDSVYKAGQNLEVGFSTGGVDNLFQVTLDYFMDQSSLAPNATRADAQYHASTSPGVILP